jgi:hypothetical protein
MRSGAVEAERFREVGCVVLRIIPVVRRCGASLGARRRGSVSGTR